MVFSLVHTKTNTMKNFLFSVFILIIITTACDKTPKSKNWNQNALFPDSAVNLGDINSPYDDYNSILPETHFGKALIFSSNRRTSGGDFDLIFEPFHAAWYWETNELVVDNSYYWQETNWVLELLSQIPGTGNQFGPYCIGFDTLIEGKYNRINLLVYSNNKGSFTYQEEFVYTESSDGGASWVTKGPFSISCISGPEKQYVSFYGPEVLTIDSYGVNPDKFTQMYFNKTVGGKSKIFRINIPDTLGLIQFLSDSVDYQEEAVTELNSEGNDFCPFVNGNLMVFTSDRTGGLGGYDLYYSYFDGTTWSEPTNFGEKINSTYDEFRSVPVNVEQFRNDLLIFSSNRPGGFGGFDLYYAGINKFGPNIFINK